ncbi:helix-turn-helix transcriptional regulator [Brevibacillus sp. WF146]|uniref:helix-turn-helix domain-containing protein n=1 Tax=Brevibacillus sp. WF146 TaxID=319501 RepID=UPI0007ED95F8|nr:helix-turn-helix transcriptional regulator [Brevibacillus sp. WF146]UYZ12125.1 helix-turn-helix transcriptional regulator [Brevibacillus sp. WF146]UYZ13412.1 helix-turn-helix transcriptional regulator [Brevibacillus sp. WF146]
MKRLKCVIKIAELRERLGISSQKDLADMAGLRPNAVSQLEHGYRWKSGERTSLQRVDLEHLEKIANAIWREKGVRVQISDLIDFVEVEE